MNKHLLLVASFSFFCAAVAYSVSAQETPGHAKHQENSHDDGKQDHEANDHKHGDEHDVPKADQDKHDTGHAHDEPKDHAHKESGDGHGHDKDDGHGHGEENRAVGPEKGITQADESLGFKLSEQAIKNFGITTQDVRGPGTLTLPRASIFFGLQERNIFRVRSGFYKRIDFVTVSKSFSQFTISVKDLKPGDKIVLTGLGFLRIAEIAAFGGIGEGHAH